MKPVGRIAIAAALCLSAAALHADTYIYSGDTTGAPTWNRPIESLTGLSTAGCAVPYDAQDFWVDLSGSYTLQNTAGTNPDGMLFLYRVRLNPKAPLHNALAGDDDSGPSYRPALIDMSLTAGEQYTLVTTGFLNSDAGTFTNQISGPGAIYPETLPEPGTLLLMGLGLAGLVALRRRTAGRQD